MYTGVESLSTRARRSHAMFNAAGNVEAGVGPAQKVVRRNAISR
jgi:hypothetical protein